MSSMIALLVTFAAVAAADMEYVSPEKQKALEFQFTQAKFDGDSDGARLRGHEWNCDMYGVRSRLQVQKNIKLYKWGSADWHNQGAQVLSDYAASNGMLVAQNYRFEDQVKLTSSGELISRLSLQNPKNTVIAYSVCRAL